MKNKKKNMKSSLRLLLVLFCLSFILTGCSNKSVDQDATDHNDTDGNNTLNIAEIGETVNTPILEITLMDFQLAPALSNTLSEGYLLPGGSTDPARNPYAAEEGNVMASASYRIKNTGTDKLKLYNYSLCIQYDNQYNFEHDLDQNAAVRWNGSFNQFSSVNTYIQDLEPLEEKEYRAYFELPNEVAENLEKPLTLCFKTYFFVDNKKDADVETFDGKHLKYADVIYSVR